MPAFERLVQQHGKLRVLFDMTDFHGWEVGAAWEDLKFGVDHFSDIERMAPVGERKRQEALSIQEFFAVHVYCPVSCVAG